MKKVVLAQILFAIFGIILISCGSIGGTETPAEIESVIQPTASLADKVAVELSAQYDTSIQYNSVGQVVRIKYTVKMLKNDLTDSTLPNVTFIGVTPICPAINSIGNLDERFDANESMDCQLDYALAQTDLDRGSLSYAATVFVYTTASNTVNTSVPTVAAKLLSVSLSANTTTYSQAGQTITYTYTITNTGTTQIGPGQCTVTHAPISASAFNCGNADATITAGGTLTCTANYTVTAADLNNASISSSATAACGSATSAQSAPLVITKTTATSTTTSVNITQHTVREGEWLWQIARCYGADPAKTVAANSQLANVAQLKAGMIVNVPNAGSVGTVHKPPEPCVTLHVVLVGETWTTIAQKYGADPGFTQYVNENSMPVGNTVKVPHYTQGMNFPVSNPTSPVSSTILTVTSSPNPTTYSSAGQTITFTYVIKNNSTTTTIGPTQCTVLDALISATPFNCGLANSSIAPGATISCSANYTITNADMSSSSITNNASASCGSAVTSASDKKTITRSVTQLGLDVIPNPTTYNAAGQVINFSYIILNTGTSNIGPAQFTVTDGLISPSAFNCGPANTTLAPNATVTCSANYTISAADMNSASISNNATAAGGGATTPQPVSKTITKQ